MAEVIQRGVNKTKIREQLLRDFQAYVEEFEHQEGKGCWKTYFENPKEGVIDFLRYQIYGKYEGEFFDQPKEQDNAQ